MMNPKVILVPYNGGDHDQATLEYALNLAKIHGAQVQCWHIAPDPKYSMVPYAVYGALPLNPEPDIKELESINARNETAAQIKFLDTLKKMNIENASFHSVTGRAEEIIAVQGRISDLIIIARSEENTGYLNAVNGALFNSGRPVILIPPGKVKQFNGKMIIAWNGSREAARAVAFSVPYLDQNNVMILTEQKEKKFPLSPDDLKKYLKAHDIEAEILSYMDEGSSLGSGILNTAQMVDAGLIVMGAWSHSRARETVLGGVTDYILRHAELPVLMAH